MRATVKSVNRTECVLEIEPQYAESLSALIDKDCEVVIEEKGSKWSLSALRYSWHLTGELARALRISQEEMHFLSLKDYAPRYLITLDAGENIEDYGVEYYEVVNTRGEYVEYMAYKGFKELNSKQMSVVIDGLVQEARQQGIPTKSDEELEHIIKEWRNEEET